MTDSIRPSFTPQQQLYTRYFLQQDPSEELQSMSPSARVVHNLLTQTRAMKGMGPWWVAMLVNLAPRAKTKTQIVYHTNIKLLVDLRNRKELGQALWAVAACIGPFDSEPAAQGMLGGWLTTAKKEREARALGSFVMHFVYEPRYPGIELYLAPVGSLTVDEEALATLKRDKEAALYRKWARRTRNQNVKRRALEMEPERLRTTLSGDVRAWQVIREKQAEEEDKKRYKPS